MSENPDPRKPPRFFERKVLMVALIVIMLVSVSYFLLHSVDMETAPDTTHGESDPGYGTEETVPPADPQQQ